MEPRVLEGLVGRKSFWGVFVEKLLYKVQELRWECVWALKLVLPRVNLNLQFTIAVEGNAPSYVGVNTNPDRPYVGRLRQVPTFFRDGTLWRSETCSPLAIEESRLRLNVSSRHREICQLAFTTFAVEKDVVKFNISVDYARFFMEVLYCVQNIAENIPSNLFDFRHRFSLDPSLQIFKVE